MRQSSSSSLLLVPQIFHVNTFIKAEEHLGRYKDSVVPPSRAMFDTVPVTVCEGFVPTLVSNASLLQRRNGQQTLGYPHLVADR